MVIKPNRRRTKKSQTSGFSSRDTLKLQHPGKILIHHSISRESVRQKRTCRKGSQGGKAAVINWYRPGRLSALHHATGVVVQQQLHRVAGVGSARPIKIELNLEGGESIRRPTTSQNHFIADLGTGGEIEIAVVGCGIVIHDALALGVLSQ